MKYEEFKETFENTYKDYFNKYFAGHCSIDNIILERIKNCMKSLLITYSKFLLLFFSLKQIEKDEKFFNNYPEKSKEKFKATIFWIGEITKEFEEVLSAYQEGITD